VGVGAVGGEGWMGLGGLRVLWGWGVGCMGGCEGVWWCAVEGLWGGQ